MGGLKSLVQGTESLLSVSISQSIAFSSLCLEGAWIFPSLFKYHSVQPVGCSHSLPSYRLAISLTLKRLDPSMFPLGGIWLTYFPYSFYSAVLFSSVV